MSFLFGKKSKASDQSRIVRSDVVSLDDLNQDLRDSEKIHSSLHSGNIGRWSKLTQRCKNRWLTLSLDGQLKFFMNEFDEEPYRVLQLEDFSTITPTTNQRDSPFTLSTKQHGHAQVLTIYAYEDEEQRKWVEAICEVLDRQKEKGEERVKEARKAEKLKQMESGDVGNMYHYTSTKNLLGGSDVEQPYSNHSSISVSSTSSYDQLDRQSSITTNQGQDPVERCGYMKKRGGFRKNFKRRFFVLTRTGNMAYYSNELNPFAIGDFRFLFRVDHL